MTQKQAPFGTLNYTYDSAGDVLTIASSNTHGASLTYTYDTLNRLATVTDHRLLAQGATSGLTTYNYDAVGNLQNFVYPNGVTSAYTYDALNRLTQMGASKNATAQSNYAYTLGAAGNRTSVSLDREALISRTRRKTRRSISRSIAMPMGLTRARSVLLLLRTLKPTREKFLFLRLQSAIRGSSCRLPFGSGFRRLHSSLPVQS